MGYLYLMMGVIISSAVLPATLTLMWSKQNAIAATLSPVLGLAVSLIAWLVTAQKEYGNLSVASTGSNNPMLAGNVAALLSPMVFIPILTYGFGPQNYDYKSMALIRLADDSPIAAEEHVDLENIPHLATGQSPEEVEKEQAKLTRASLIAKTLTGIMTIALLVLWPMPMYGSGYVFSKPFFTGWVVIGILWIFCSAGCVAVYPLWEGRHSMAHTFGSILRDLSGKGRAKPMGTVTEGEVVEGKEGRSDSEGGAGTPVEEVKAEKGIEM